MHAPCMPSPWNDALGRCPINSKQLSVNIEPVIRAGRGALALHGKFWYPALVVQRYGHNLNSWVVRWWRGCQFELDGNQVEPGSTSIVSLGQIIDSLWLKQEERRKIRVSFINLLTETTHIMIDISSESGHMRTKSQQERTFSLTHRQFPTLRRSTKCFNHTRESYTDC